MGNKKSIDSLIENTSAVRDAIVIFILSTFVCFASSLFDIKQRLMEFFIARKDLNLYGEIMTASAILALALGVFSARRLGELKSEMSIRRRVEEDLDAARFALEIKVTERTAELSKANSALMAEIVEREKAEEQVRRNAFYDGLTGLPNRALFLDRLSRSVALSERRGEYMFAVLILDLDRFKIVNDSLGHTAGDKLLTLVGKRLHACLRPGDTIARLGGDEFAILLDDIDDVRLVPQAARRILDELGAPFNIEGRQVFITASIGIAANVSGYEESEEFLRDADAAMHRAKSLGKSRYEIFDKSLHEQAMEFFTVESSLRGALQRGEFRVYYQPVVSSADGGMTGMEALLRWAHPERGVVPPGEFLPIAEETGIIVPIGEWVLKTACAQTKAWNDALMERLKVAVNFSGRQFGQIDLAGLIGRTLRETGLPAEMLVIEITEGTAMGDEPFTMRMLAEMREMGVEISIDDFGTGYSSLEYLRKFHINRLKIDKSFVGDVTTDSKDAEIARAVIALGHALDLKVLAEGVETEAQADFMRLGGCDEMQGFFFSRPLPAEDFERLLKEKRRLP